MIYLLTAAGIYFLLLFYRFLLCVATFVALVSGTQPSNTLCVQKPRLRFM